MLVPSQCVGSACEGGGYEVYHRARKRGKKICFRSNYRAVNLLESFLFDLGSRHRLAFAADGKMLLRVLFFCAAARRTKRIYLLAVLADVRVDLIERAEHVELRRVQPGLFGQVSVHVLVADRRQPVNVSVVPAGTTRGQTLATQQSNCEQTHLLKRSCKGTQRWEFCPCSTCKVKEGSNFS